MSLAGDGLMEEEQEDTVALLSRPDTLGPDVATVRCVETHVSKVFIGGERVLKLKRAVRFPYLDFSTPDLRRQACEAEVTINSRTAPDIYKGAVAVTRRADGGVELDGGGEPVDWVVEMVRFDEDTLFDRLASSGKLRRRAMEELADTIAHFHDGAEIRTEAGGRSGIAMIIKNNVQAFAEAGAEILDVDQMARLGDLSHRAIERIGPILEGRRLAGSVRHCHGDLHLRNICLVDGRPTLFDAIEFDPAFAEIDVLYDVAFLLMDLDYRKQRRLANVTLNRYLDVTGEVSESPGVLSALPLFLSMRAAIRSHVDAAQAAMLSDPGQRARRAEEAKAYLAMALDYLSPPPPRLIAVGGLSGSGKSRMARELAPLVGAAPGARVVRSDVTRKRLMGVDLTDRLGPEGYVPEVTTRTFEAVYDEVRAGLADGHSVIADTVFSNPAQRDTVAGIAGEFDVPFQGLWLEAPREVMEARVTERQHNVSDATVEIVRLQQDYDLGEILWHRIDSSGPRDATVNEGRTVLSL